MKFPAWMSAVVIGLLLLLGSVFVVSEGQGALVLNLGKVVRSDIGPGLHFKLPLVESARVFAGVLWELKVKDKAAAEGLLYFRQGDGRLCGLMSPEDARKRLNDWLPTAMR